jgi:hypothetical protein
MTTLLDADLHHLRTVLLLALARKDMKRVANAMRRIARIRGEMKQGEW